MKNLLKLHNKAVARLLNPNPVETSSLWLSAGAQVNDRVIVNSGTAKSPVYHTGTITKVHRHLHKLDILVDTGDKIQAQVVNRATKLVAFSKVNRIRTQLINAADLPLYIDFNRWVSNALLDKTKPGATICPGKPKRSIL